MTEEVSPIDEPVTNSQPAFMAELMEQIQQNPSMLAVFARIETAQFTPLPSTTQLEQYERIVPGSAKMILDDASAQTHHRIKQEALVIGGNSKRSWMGLFTSALIEAGVIAGVIIAIIKNESWTVPIFVAFGALPAGTYAISQRRQRLERQGNNATTQIPRPGSPTRPYEPD